MVFGFLLAWVLRPPKNLKSIYILMATFSNLGFMGIPVAKSLYGSEGVVYVSFYILLYNVIVYTYGMALARRAAREKSGVGSTEKVPLAVSLKRMINPGVVAALLMRNMGFDTVVFGVFIIELAMPIGSIIGLFAKECGADDAYCMKGTVLSTLASIITIPLVGLFL